MQRTFGSTVGLEPIVPSRRHPDDIVVCVDGTELRYADAHLDCRGCAHSTDEDRDEADLTIVAEVLDGIDEWVSEYCRDNTDYPDGYAHIVQECSHDWPVPVKEWIETNYPDYDCFIVDALVDEVCDDLDRCSDWEPEFNSNEYAAYSGPGCCLWGTDIGEYEEQVDVSTFPEFARLHEDGRLADLLEIVNCNACISSTALRWLRESRSDHPCFYSYHMPGGRWDFVVSAERMRQAVTNGIIGLCRA